MLHLYRHYPFLYRSTKITGLELLEFMFLLDGHFSLVEKVQGKKASGIIIIFKISFSQTFLPRHMEYLLRNTKGLSDNSICYNSEAQKCERYDRLADDHVTYRELQPTFIQKFYTLIPTAISSTFR